jgi:thioester reductase-like protein
MGKDVFDEIVKRIVPISGNLISPDLSLSEQDKESIVTNVNVVIHCAATLDYSERLDLALEVNKIGLCK